MVQTGRNELCPCGSGKKYKKCCLLKEAISISKNTLWEKACVARNSLCKKIDHYAKQFYNEKDFNDAWNEWCLDYQEPIGKDENEFNIFMSWFIYNRINNKLPNSFPQIAIAYWADTIEKPNMLSEDEHAFLNSLLNEPFSFYEILKANRGEGIFVRCLFTGRELYVYDHLGSQNMTEGGILFGRIGMVGEIVIFDVIAHILFPCEWKSQILFLRKDIKRMKRVKKDDLLKIKHLCYAEELIRQVYRDMRDSAINPKPRTLANTDGDIMSFHTIIYNIDDMYSAFDSLCHLCFSETKESILNNAEKDVNGNILKIEFPWLKKGNKRVKTMENTILGHIMIENKQLTVEVNSENRANKIKKIISKACAQKVRFKKIIVNSLEDKISKHNDKKSLENVEKNQKDLMNYPEMKTKMQDIFQKNMESWIYERIPALGKKTPVQAMKTAEGREMVETLLNSFEKRAGHTCDRDFEVDVIYKVRKKLFSDIKDI